MSHTCKHSSDEFYFCSQSSDDHRPVRHRPPCAPASAVSFDILQASGWTGGVVVDVVKIILNTLSFDYKGKKLYDLIKR